MHRRYDLAELTLRPLYWTLATYATLHAVGSMAAGSTGVGVAAIVAFTVRGIVFRTL